MVSMWAVTRKPNSRAGRHVHIQLDDDVIEGINAYMRDFEIDSVPVAIRAILRRQLAAEPVPADIRSAVMRIEQEMRLKTAKRLGQFLREWEEQVHEIVKYSEEEILNGIQSS